MRSGIRPPTAVAVVLMLLFAACGGGASPSAAPASPGTTASPGATASGEAPSGSPTGEACPDGIPDDPVTITYWSSSEPQGEALQREIIAEYTALHPNVTINYEIYGLFDSFDAWNLHVPAGEGPTIMLAYEPWIEIFHSQDLLVPAVPEAMCEGSQQDIIDRYIEGTIDPLTRDGDVYALPEQRNAWSLLVNNDLFTEAGLSLETDIPETWDEVAALQDDLHKEENGRTVQKGFEFRYTSGGQWMGATLTGMIYQAGGDVLDENERPTFNGPEGVDALTQWKENIVDPSVTSNAQGDPYQDFAQEQDVMSFGGPNALSFVYQINPTLEGRVTVASMPDAGPEYGGGASYGFHYVVSANASEAERAAAWHFLDFLTADANRWFADTGLLQPKVGWYEEPSAAEFEGLDVFVQDLADSRPLPRTRYWSQLQSAFVGAVERVAYEDADPKASLDQAAQEYLAAIGG